jgi:hypothetical protein
MARSMTPAQTSVLARLMAGWPVENLEWDPTEDNEWLPFDLHQIMDSNACMDGVVVRCHRTIKTNTPAGSKVQSFRIYPDGSLERKL